MLTGVFVWDDILSLFCDMSFAGLDPEVVILMKDLTTDEKLLFQSQYNNQKKDVGLSVILALFLGGLGVHKFYFGQIGLGIVYLLFCWTFIPTIIALIEAIIMRGTVRKYNSQLARSVKNNLLIMRN